MADDAQEEVKHKKVEGLKYKLNQLLKLQPSKRGGYCEGCQELFTSRSSLRRHWKNPSIVDCCNVQLPPVREQSPLPKEKKARNAEHYARTGGKDKQIKGRKRKALLQEVRDKKSSESGRDKKSRKYRFGGDYTKYDLRVTNGVRRESDWDKYGLTIIRLSFAKSLMNQKLFDKDDATKFLLDGPTRITETDLRKEVADFIGSTAREVRSKNITSPNELNDQLVLCANKCRITRYLADDERAAQHVDSESDTEGAEVATKFRQVQFTLMTSVGIKRKKREAASAAVSQHLGGGGGGSGDDDDDDDDVDDDSQ